MYIRIEELLTCSTLRPSQHHSQGWIPIRGIEMEKGKRESERKERKRKGRVERERKGMRKGR